MELELSDVCGIFGWQVWRQFPEKLERRSRASNLSYFPKYIRYLPFSHTEQIAEQRILQASHSRGVINVFAETLSAKRKRKVVINQKVMAALLTFHVQLHWRPERRGLKVCSLTGQFCMDILSAKAVQGDVIDRHSIPQGRGSRKNASVAIPHHARRWFACKEYKQKYRKI